MQVKDLGIRTDYGKDFDNWAYGPICSEFFDEMMRIIPRRSELAFVDVGSGKGLPLLLAGNYGFRRVIGIELSPELCEIAKQNIERWNARKSKPVLSEIVCEDFMKCDLGREATVFFLNNPFPEVVALLAIKHIESSVEKHPRRIVIAYRRMQRQVLRYLESSKHFRLDFATPYWHIFSTR